MLISLTKTSKALYLIIISANKAVNNSYQNKIQLITTANTQLANKIEPNYNSIFNSSYKSTGPKCQYLVLSVDSFL